MAAVTPYIPISQAGAGTTHVVTGISGQKIRLISLTGALSAAGTVQLKSSGGTALSGAVNLATGQPLDMDYNPEGWTETLSGEGLDLISATGAFNGLAVVQYVPSGP